MASKRRNRRRRRGRASFPLRLLCLAVVIAAFLGALTMFFRIDMIVVEGNERYTEEQIIEAAGVQKEQNLVLLNKYKVKQSIFDTLPYVETVVINRKYPDALILTVTARWRRLRTRILINSSACSRCCARRRISSFSP